MTTWAADTASQLTETFSGAFEGDGIVVAVGAIDDEHVVLHDPPDSAEDSRFEIGSLTKPITATLAAVLAEEGQLSWTDPIGKWLDAGPNEGITVEQLATHTSGLPRLAPNAFGKGVDQNNPYAHYSAELAEKGLREARLAPDEERGYSNFGFQLLGLIVERAGGLSYEKFLRTRFLEPLSMRCSGVRGSGMEGTELPGHTDGRAVPHWDQQLPGPGGVEATMADLLKFLQACLAPPAGDLGRAIAASQQPRVATGQRQQGLGWTILEGGYVWHNGGTGGFTSSAVFDPAKKRAVAVMVNSGGGELDAAVMRAIKGEDPRSARPQPPGPEWEARGRELATALLEGRFEDVYAAMDEEFRAKVTLKQLSAIWKLGTLRAGKPGDIEVTCRRRPGSVAAEVTIARTRKPTRLAVAWRDDGAIAGFTILKGDKPSPF
ncbi:MAG TPA: serine hydrolase [Acidimicrobiales bacterium]|nr:serine hydrolase [Acidimicrobiales bacterium]